MDAVVLVGVGLAPSVQHDDSHRLPLGELRVVRQRPREPRARHSQRDLPKITHSSQQHVRRAANPQQNHTDLRLASESATRLRYNQLDLNT